MGAFQHKRGDTFIQDLVLSEGGVATDLTGWEARAHVRYRTEQISDLTVVWTSRVNGQVQFLEDDTTAWPAPAVLEMDFEFTDSNGVVMSTETITFDCLKDITYDEPA